MTAVYTKSSCLLTGIQLHKLPCYAQIVNIFLLQIKTLITDNKPRSSQVININYPSYHLTSIQYFVTKKCHPLKKLTIHANRSHCL